ncbi:Uncharacterised protein [Zhongshania aliphaticivorans]|uniref:Uncharacterized protein n=1 Tax=Zhongshania aliphaticivorans TaxID=1470434 RepID=A0A5S9PSK5_9GAMM|nr:Uncharacterised protein [Zhongshania aliphaticivorans]CAA0107333.1 Uncharacterised protein [Zhongshania aliphaticivorans]
MPLMVTLTVSPGTASPPTEPVISTIAAASSAFTTSSAVTGSTMMVAFTVGRLSSTGLSKRSSALEKLSSWSVLSFRSKGSSRVSTRPSRPSRWKSADCCKPSLPSCPSKPAAVGSKSAKSTPSMIACCNASTWSTCASS